MAASPSLSHSSQDKAEKQVRIQCLQGVSDECGSGVVRVVQEAQSIPGVCSLCAVDRGASEGAPGSLHWIQYNAAISSIDGELAELVGERAAILNQGEPPGCHADDCRDGLPWQHVTMVT